MAALLAHLDRYRKLAVPVAAIGLIAVIVVPLPPVLMDLLIAANIALAALILMTVIFITRPLEFSVFPSVLLATTLLRLVLNIATTRLILSADTGGATAAGKVIEAFASFVTGSSVVIGVILFLILIVVQFVVITKGATRISEVAARFTLDGMPGKQMAIDADLNAGLIDEATARERRDAVSQESDFYGAMDGAAKFVRGDAVAGILITLVNIVGGLAVGIAVHGLPFLEASEMYTRLTIGDGLVSQLPALVISIAAALIVTRSGSRADLSTELTGQLGGRATALGVTGGFLALLAFTGMPMVPMLGLAAVCGGLAYVASRNAAAAEAQAERAKAAEAAGTGSTGSGAPGEDAPIEEAMQVDTLELEVGYALVQVVDAGQGGDLLERISMTRRTLAVEQGLVMPPVRIHDNMQLVANDYRIKIRGNTVARGQVYPGEYLAMDGGLADTSEDLPGRRTREPTFGLEAVWIDAAMRERAETLGYTVVNATLVLATHLTEVVKTHAHELLDFEETGQLMEQLRKRSPKLAEAVFDGDTPTLKTADLQRVLQNLLAERVSIRDMGTIVETLGKWGTQTRDLGVLTEYVRNALRRTICNQHASVDPAAADPMGDAAGGDVFKPRLYCVSLDPAVEDLVASYVQRSDEGTSLTMPPAVSNRVAGAIVDELNQLLQAGHNPVVLASPQVRAMVRKLVEPHLPACAVLGYNEVTRDVEVESLGLVQMQPTGTKTPPTGAEPSATDPFATAGAAPQAATVGAGF